MSLAAFPTGTGYLLHNTESAEIITAISFCTALVALDLRCERAVHRVVDVVRERVWSGGCDSSCVSHCWPLNDCVAGSWGYKRKTHIIN
jgi:hypothetical protein